MVLIRSKHQGWEPNCGGSGPGCDKARNATVKAAASVDAAGVPSRSNAARTANFSPSLGRMGLPALKDDDPASDLSNGNVVPPLLVDLEVSPAMDAGPTS